MFLFKQKEKQNNLTDLWLKLESVQKFDARLDIFWATKTNAHAKMAGFQPHGKLPLLE